MNQIGPGLRCVFCGEGYGEHDVACRYYPVQPAIESPTDSTLRYLLAQTTTRAEAMQAALWKLEKMTLWEWIWYGRGVVREALKIGDHRP